MLHRKWNALWIDTSQSKGVSALPQEAVASRGRTEEAASGTGFSSEQMIVGRVHTHLNDQVSCLDRHLRRDLEIDSLYASVCRCNPTPQYACRLSCTVQYSPLCPLRSSKGGFPQMNSYVSTPKAQ